MRAEPLQEARVGLRGLGVPSVLREPVGDIELDGRWERRIGPRLQQLEIELRGKGVVALAVRGVGSCWIGSTIFAPDVVRSVLELPGEWEPLGAVAIGYPGEPPSPRDPAPPGDLLVHR